MQKWTNKEIEILNKFYSIKDKKFLLKYFKIINPNRTWLSIYKKANKLGLRKITYKNEIDYILKEKYSTYPLPVILEEVRIFIPSIIKTALIARANRLGLARKTFAWKSQEKEIKIPKPSKDFAWFLGALAGDGNVRSDDKSKHTTYVVILSVTSRQFAFKFKEMGEKLFGIKASLKIHKKYKLENKWRKFWTVRFHSKKMVSFLGDWKENYWVNTLNQKFKWILDKPIYIRYFLSGLFDSDGGVNKGEYTHRLFLTIKNKNTQIDV